MKNFMLLLIASLFCFTAHSQQTFNSLKVKDLELPSETANTILSLDGSKKVKSTTIDLTELSYLDGVTSNIQTQLDSKGATITGAATTIVSSNLTPDRAVVSDGSGKIAISSVTGVELSYISGLTSSAQTQINSKATGAASSTDNCVATFDSTTGKIIQCNSPVVVSDAGIITGATGLTTSGVINSTGTNHSQGIVRETVSTDSATTGSNATLADPSTPVVRVSNASLASIDMIDSTTTGRVLTLINSTGVTVTINNDTGATAAKRILTGTKGSIKLKDEASLILKYDTTETKWLVIGGNGAGGAGGSRLELATDPSFEDTITEGSCTGCVASSEPTVILNAPNNTKSLKLTFTAASGGYTLNKATGSEFLGVDFEEGAWVKTSLTGCTFVANLDGVATTDVRQITSTQWTYYSIPTKGGTTSNGWSVLCPTSTGVVYVDETKNSPSEKQGRLVDIQNRTQYFYNSVSGGALTAGSTSITTGATQSGSGLFSVGLSRITALTTINVNIHLSSNAASASITQCNIQFTSPLANISRDTSRGTSSALDSSCSGSVILTAGQSIDLNTNTTSTAYISIVATAPSLTYVNSAETFSTDYTPLVFKSTAIVAADPVGTFNTYLYTISSNTSSICGTAPTQTTSDMVSNGILTYTRAYNAASTCPNPAMIAIKIGTGMKGYSINVYKSTGKTTSGSVDAIWAGNAQSGIFAKNYDEASGILWIDIGYNWSNLTTTALYSFIGNTTQSSGYLVVTASKNPAMTGWNLDQVYFEGAGNAGQAITTNVTNIPFITTTDTHGAWNGSQYTIPRSGVYQISGSIFFTTATTRQIQMYIGGVASKYIGPDTSSSYSTFNTFAKFIEGQVISIRLASGSGTLNNTANVHNIVITKVPGSM